MALLGFKTEDERDCWILTEAINAIEQGKPKGITVVHTDSGPFRVKGEPEQVKSWIEKLGRFA